MSDRKADGEAESPPASFIVPVWAAIFRALSVISLFGLLRWAMPWLQDKNRSYAVVETWVVAHTALALFAALLAHAGVASTLVTVLLVYGGFRVFEIVVTQVNVLLFDEWRARRAGRSYSLRGYRRILILLLHNYAEVVFWFVAALVSFNRWSWLVLDDPSFSATFRATLLSMVAFSTEGVRPLGRYAGVLLTLQSLVGVFMTVLTLARFLSLMPTPATQEPTERE
jgi:hypothetical protein